MTSDFTRILVSIAVVATMLAIVAYAWYSHGRTLGPPGPLYPIGSRMMNFDGSGPYVVIPATDKFAITSTTPTRVHFGIAYTSGNFVMSMGSGTPAADLFVIWIDAENGVQLRVGTITVSSGIKQINVLDGGWHTVDYAIDYPTSTTQSFTLTVDGQFIQTATGTTGRMAVASADVNIGNRPAGALPDYGKPLLGCVRDLTLNGTHPVGTAVGKVGSSCKTA
jgi:hypothetical protein